MTLVGIHGYGQTMKARRISAKVSATPDELEALLALLERERDRLIESGEAESPLGRSLWAATDGVGSVLEAHSRKREGLIVLAQSKLGRPKLR